MPDSPDDDGPFGFLRDQDAFLKRYVLSLVLAPPPSRRGAMHVRPGRHGKDPAPPAPRPASKKT